MVITGTTVEDDLSTTHRKCDSTRSDIVGHRKWIGLLSQKLAASKCGPGTKEWVGELVTMRPSLIGLWVPPGTCGAENSVTWARVPFKTPGSDLSGKVSSCCVINPSNSCFRTASAILRTRRKARFISPSWKIDLQSARCADHFLTDADIKKETYKCYNRTRWIILPCRWNWILVWDLSIPGSSKYIFQASGRSEPRGVKTLKEKTDRRRVYYDSFEQSVGCCLLLAPSHRQLLWATTLVSFFYCKGAGTGSTCR